MVSKRFYLLVALAIFSAGCAANMSTDSKVIAVVGDTKITYGDFKRQYDQNYYGQSDTAATKENMEKFLNLLVDYNLKLLSAQKDHLADDPSVKAEIQLYEQQLAVSYVMEHEITEPAVKQIYDRQKYEVRATQLFVPFAKDSLGKTDTLKSYNEVVGLIKAIQEGASLDSLQRKYRGSDTYYLTAGNFLQYLGGREFEDQLYALQPGQVSPSPIKTSFGYLIIKLTDRRPRVESIRASHILIPIPPQGGNDTLKAYNEAIAILDSIKNGVDFGKLAERNSSDKYSAVRGGDLGFFSRGQMVREFDEAAFSMKVGDVVGPVRTRFGYHIIKLTDVKQVPSYEQVKDKLRENYLNAGYKMDLQNFIDRLKRTYGYKEDDAQIRYFYGKLDSTKQFSELDLDSLLTPSDRARTIFTFDDCSGTVDTVVSIVNADESVRPLLPNWTGINTMINQASKQMLITHYSVSEARSYPNFDSLITQYENGILIYHMEQQEIWNKIQTSDSALKPYYFDHADKYRWPERADLSEIHVSKDSLANALYALLQTGEDFDSVAARYTTRPGLAAKAGHWGLFTDSTNALVTAGFAMKEGEFSKPIPFEGGYSIIKVNKFVAPQPKTFDEARGEVSSDYQESESKRIQGEWLNRLRKEFGVEIDNKTFDELIATK